MGDQIRRGRPNPLADLVLHGGPDLLADLDQGDQIHGDTSLSKVLL